MGPENSRRAFFKGLLGEATSQARNLHDTLGPLSPLHKLDTLGALGPYAPPAASIADVADNGVGASTVARPPHAKLPDRCADMHDLLTLAAETGLSTRTHDVRRLARHSMYLTPAQPPRPAAPGASRLGGHPDLPLSMPWPSWQGSPLCLLAQIDLGAIALPDAAEVLPASGSLLFFHNLDEASSGPHLDTTGSTQVLFLDAPDPTTAVNPVNAEDAAGGCAVELSAALVLPRVWASAVQALDLDESEHLAWEELRRQLALSQGAEISPISTEAAITHHLLGYPDETRGSMPLTCELLAAGHDASDTYAHAHPLAAALEPHATRWRLLLQLSVDEHLGWPADAPNGRLYFWIDEQALRRHDFTHVHAIAQ